MADALTCCFTGNRPQKLGFSEDSENGIILKETLKKHIIRLIDEENVRHFISGLALGVDMFAAELVLELMQSYPDITLEGVAPCRMQDKLWHRDDKQRYKMLCAACDEFTVISEAYTPICMAQRNQYMVDKSDIVLAVWNGEKGGTANTLNYARRKGKQILILPTKPVE